MEPIKANGFVILQMSGGAGIAACKELVSSTVTERAKCGC
jgi:hypothetical protein